MMTKNDSGEADLRAYAKKTHYTLLVLLVLNVIGLGMAKLQQTNSLVDPLLGTLIGIILSTANLYAMGLAFYFITIKKGSRWSLLLPIASFLLLCIATYLLVSFWDGALLGFALGLASPVFFGMVIVFMGREV